MEKLTITKMPGDGGGLGRIFQAARTPCMKALRLGGSMMHSSKCREASVVKHKGTRERSALDEGELHEGDRAPGILRALE